MLTREAFFALLLNTPSYTVRKAGKTGAGPAADKHPAARACLLASINMQVSVFIFMFPSISVLDQIRIFILLAAEAASLAARAGGPVWTVPSPVPRMAPCCQCTSKGFVTVCGCRWGGVSSVGAQPAASEPRGAEPLPEAPLHHVYQTHLALTHIHPDWAP